MAAQHFAQGLVHDVRDRVVAHGGGAHGRVDLGLHRVAHVQGALFQRAVVAEHIGLDLEGVAHRKTGRAAGDHALVAHLAAAFCVERGRVQHHHAVLTSLQGCSACPVYVDCYDFCSFCKMLIAGELVGRAGVFQRLVHLELAGRAGLGLLLFHGGLEAGLVHFHVALAAHVVGQVEREAIGVVQLEGHFAGQHLGAAVQRRVQNFHAVGQRLEEALFFGLEHIGDALLLLADSGIGIAHQAHQIGHQLVEERGLLAQLVAVADGAAHDAALHVAAAFVAGDHAVAHQEGGGADVVGNHAQALGCPGRSRRSRGRRP